MMTDPVVMSKLADFGLHGYQGVSAGSAGVYSFLQESAYPNLDFWMTEYNVWCQVCETGGQSMSTWDEFRGTAEYLLSQLANGASGGMVWEGYDSIYRNNNNDGERWSFWGLFAVDDPNAVPKTYTPRKNFYTLSQITKFVRPGAMRIGVSGLVGLDYLLAFYNTNNGQLTLTGVNPAATPTNLSGMLTSLPDIGSLELYYTDSMNNLVDSATIPVNKGGFAATVPADCVFTLATTNHPPSPAPVSAPASSTTFSFGPPITPVWDVSGTYQITNCLQGAKLQPRDVVFNGVALGVDAHGHMQGSGTILVRVGDDPVEGDYKVSGNVTGGGTSTHVNFSIRFKGNGVVAGVLTTCNISAKYNLKVNPAGLTLVGTSSGSAHFSNLGGGSLKSDISLPLPPAVDGGWMVTLDIAPFGTKLFGTARVLVDNTPVTTLATKVNGNLPKHSTTATVKLSGYGNSAGTQLNLEFTPILGATNLPATLKGKVLGQNVKN